MYIVPTPIGNLEDITLRALRVLKEVDFILAEDTRTTGNLLKHYNIDKKLVPHHLFNEHKTIENIVERLKAGANISYRDRALRRRLHFLYRALGSKINFLRGK